MIPRAAKDLGGLDHLSWVVTLYLLASTVATPLYGKLGDLYDRKRLFQIAIVVFLVGSVLCGLAQTMPQLIAFRAVQGIGGGGLTVLAPGDHRRSRFPRERGRYHDRLHIRSARPHRPNVPNRWTVALRYERVLLRRSLGAPDHTRRSGCGDQ